MKYLRINEIKKLIAAFYNAETTVEEEQKLLQYFNGKEVAEELKDDQKLFLQFYDSTKIETPHSLENKLNTLVNQLAEKDREKPQRKKKSLWIWVSSAAAGIAILISLGWYFYTSPTTKSNLLSQEYKPKDTYTDPQQAYVEAAKALAMVSENFNKGINQLNMASSQIENTNKKVKKIISGNQKN